MGNYFYDSEAKVAQEYIATKQESLLSPRS